MNVAIKCLESRLSRILGLFLAGCCLVSLDQGCNVYTAPHCKAYNIRHATQVQMATSRVSEGALLHDTTRASCLSKLAGPASYIHVAVIRCSNFKSELVVRPCLVYGATNHVIARRGASRSSLRDVDGKP